MKKTLLLSSLIGLTTAYTLPCFASECLQESPNMIINEELKQASETALAPYLDTPFFCKLDDKFSIILKIKSGTYSQFYMEDKEATSELSFVHAIVVVAQLSYSDDEGETRVIFEQIYRISLPNEADTLLSADALHEYIQQTFTTVVKLFSNKYLEMIYEYQKNLESTVEAEKVPQE